MLSTIGLIVLIIGIVLIIIGKRKSNKTLQYIGIILLVLGIILGAKDFITGLVEGFSDGLSRP